MILGAGVLFAVFPFAYASLFSGLYVPMMLLLLVIILRTVSMEFRSKMSSPGWRSVWDTVFALASLGLAFMLGMAFGLVVGGLPIDANGDITTDTLGLITPFAVVVGVTTVAMFSVQGGLYLSMKTDGDLAGRIIRLTPRLMVAFFLLNTLVVIAMVAFQQQVTEVYETDIWPIVFPALALAGVIVAGMSLRAGRHARAFVAWSATIALSADLGCGRALPEPHRLDHRPGLQHHDLQRRVEPEHPRDLPDLRGDRRPVRVALHDRRVLHLPRPSEGRIGWVLGVR